MGRFLSLRDAPPGGNGYSNGDATAELIDPTVTPAPESNADEVVWDVFQTGLGFAGMLPIVGIGFDLANSALYAARGKYDEAAMSLVSAIPIGGDLAGATNLARKTATLAIRHAAQNVAAQAAGVAVSRATGGDREFGVGQVAAAALTGGAGAKLSAAGGRAVNASRSLATRTAALGAGYAGFTFAGGAAQQYLDTGDVDWRQALHEAGVAGLSAMLGQRAFDKTCFSGDTPMVARNERGWLRADEVRVDDYLASRDEHDPDAPVVWNRVEEVFVAQGELWELRWQGRTIGTTAEHPFYVFELGWTPARELKPGMLLATLDGRYLPLESVASTGRTETVYNFRIAEGHTYFVGTTEWNAALWAHNACAIRPGPRTDNRVGHNRKIRQVAREVTAKGDMVVKGGRAFDGITRKEAVIKTIGGYKESRRPDILVQRRDGSIYGINVGLSAANGAPIRREQMAIQDLNEAGYEMQFVPYRRKRS